MGTLYEISTELVVITVSPSTISSLSTSIGSVVKVQEDKSLGGNFSTIFPSGPITVQV